MTIDRLLETLRTRDIALWLDGEHLRVRAPAGCLDPALRAALAAHKPALVARLRAAEAAPAAPDDAADAHAPFPLTPIQQAYWLGRSALDAEGLTATYSYFEIDLDRVEPARLRAALRRLVARHPMLRAVFDEDGRQRIRPDAPAPEVPLIDLSAESPADRDAALAALRDDLSHRILPADTGPLYDLRLVRLAPDRHRLLVGLDLLVADVSSGLLLAEECVALYDDPERALPPIGLTFRDYLLTERDDAAERAAARAFWAAEGPRLPPAPALPYAPVPDGEPVRFARRRADLPGPRWRRFTAAARARGLTPAAALCAAYAETLAAWSRRAPMTLNLTVFDRRPIHPHVDRVVGDFTETLLLAVDPGPRAAFAERVGALQATLWTALEHRALGGVEVLRLINRARPRGHEVRMPVVFTAALRRDGQPAPDPRLAEGIDRMAYGVSQTPQVWLDHQAIELGDRLVFNWDAAEARFPPGLLDAMFESYVALLGRLADDETAWDAPADVAPADLAARWARYNATEGPTGEGTLWDGFAAAAERYPDRPAIIAPDRTLTYAALSRRAAAVHAALGAVEPGRPIAIVMRRHWAQAVAALGIHRAGGAYVPLDADWPAARVAGVIAEAGIATALTTADVAACHPWPDGIEVISVDDMPPREDTPPPAPQDATRLAYVIYTSGSTGRPKGVMIDHRGAVNTVADVDRRYRVGPDDRVLALSSLGFDLSVYDLFGLLAAGGAAVLPPADAGRDPARWLAQMRSERVTLWNTVPALMEMLVEHAEQAGERLPSSLRRVMLSGDWIPVSLPDRIRALADDVAVTSLGGATEASIWSILHEIGAVDRARPSIPYGRPMQNQRMYVLDPDRRLCPVWAVGELYIGGIGVALGYAGDPEQTAARFVRHPETGERLYRTGDLGRLWPDGTIEFLGREDGQVKVGGHRIELGEITAALVRHPAVRAAVVDAAGAPPGPRRLVAYVVPESSELSDSEPSESSDGMAWLDALSDMPSLTRQTPPETARATEALRRTALAGMAHTLRRLGAFAVAGAVDAADGLVERGAIHADFRRVVHRWLVQLAAHGRLERLDATRFRAPAPLPDAAPDWSDVPTGPGVPPALVALGEDMWRHHADLLADRRDPLEFVFPDGGLERARAIYGEFDACARLNAMVAEAIAGQIAARPADAPPLRVIEVGAGTGVTAEAVLAAVPRGALRYTATDVSSFFAAHLAAVVGDRGDFAVLDMERDPTAQGFAAGAWDVVVANNVLHNAHALPATLARLAGLLAPGGALMVAEAVAEEPIGLAAALMLHRGADLPLDRPLLPDADTWDAAFAEAGLPVRALAPPGEPLRLYVARGRPALDRAALRAHLAATLPGYMVPDVFIALDALPLTANGKIDRRRLPAPDEARPARAAAGEAPRDETERALAALWAEQLGREAVGVHDDFFEVGGDSLSAVRLAGRIRQTLGIDLPLRTFFAHPTIAALAPLCAVDGERAPAPPALPTITPDPAHRFEPFPLTDVQHAYWIGRQGGLELGRTACQVYLEFPGATDLEPKRFEAALRRLIARHDTLRSVVRADGRQQTLREVPLYDLAVADLRDLCDEAREARLEAIRVEMSEAETDPAAWPLFEWRLSRLPDGWRVHFRQDALFADGWSLFTIGRDLATLYAAPDAPPAPLSLSFRDYVRALGDVRDSAAYAAASAWWDARLEDLPPAPDLPLARDPASLARPRFARRSHVVPEAAWRRLRARTDRLGVTPSALLLTAFARTLAGWSRHPRFTLNLTLFNRLPVHPEVDALVGDFTTLSLLACDGDPDAPVADAVVALQRQLWADLDHRIVSGVEVIRRLAAREGDGPRARMPVVFTSTLGFRSLDAMRDMLGDPLLGRSQTPQVWLDHQVWAQADGVCLAWDAVDDLFPAGLVDAMFDAYVATVTALAEDEAAWSDPRRLPPLMPADQRARRAALDATDGPLPGGLLHQGVFEQAARTPDAAAVIAGATLSWRALARRARAIGDRLIALGATPGSPVAVVLPKGAGQVAALVGVLDAGAPYLPIDPALPAARIAHLIAHGEARIALVPAGRGLALPDGIAAVEVDALDGMIDAIHDSADAIPTFRARCAPDDLAYVIYTSGSTGQPKGVMIDHRAALNTVDDVNTRWRWGPGDRVFGISRASFDLSVQDVFGALAAGAGLVLPPADALRDPARWIELVEAHRVTVWNSVPTLMDMLVTHVEGRGGRLETLRLVMLSGDWIPVSLPDRIRALAPKAEVVSLGGATEAAIWSIAHPIEAVDPSWASIPYGRPMRNQRLYVLDEGMRVRPDHAVGELYIGGVGVARGYFGDPAQTAARFVRHPRTGERLYRTGDLGRYRPEGDIEFLGRLDFQVKIGGHRVEPGEIEAALLARPEVAQAAVLAVGDPRGERRLVAYVVPSADAHPSEGEPADLSGLVTDPAERLAFKLRRPGLRRDLADAPSVALPPPPADAALAPRWTARRSVRRFEPSPVPLAALGALLAELRPIRLPDAPLPKHRYPSAGDLYPVQVYVAAAPGRVAGLPAGVWYHDPVAHRLRRLSDAAPSAVWHDPANRALAEGAAFTLLLVAHDGAIAPLYGPRAADFGRLEAGHVGQVLMEAAPAAGLGLCPVGGLDVERLRGPLRAAPDLRVVYGFVGGVPAAGHETDAISGSHEMPSDATAPAPLDVEALRAALGARLPAYMVPDRIVVLDRLPLTANGKLDRAALPTPDAARPAAPRAPASASEATLAGMVGALIGREAVPVDRNLFELGCNSLHVVQLHNRVFEELGVELPITTIFARPTIAELAAELAIVEPAPVPSSHETLSHQSLSHEPSSHEPSSHVPPPVMPSAPAPSPSTPTPAPSVPGAHAPIAIVGLAARFPGAIDADAFQRNVRAGVVSIRFFDPDTLTMVDAETRAAPDFVPAAPVIDDIFAFDADFFGCTARDAELLGPQKRLFLELCHRALEHAGVAASEPPGPIGVFAGDSLSSYLIGELDLRPDPSPTVAAFQALVSNDKDYLTTQVAYRLGLDGPAISVQTACSTSLVAVHLACQALRAGECAVALAGGATVRVPQEGGYRPVMEGIFSADGRCRPFDAAASGTVFGSGVGVVVLRPLADAVADGDAILAVIRGSAVGNDGRRRAGFTAPGQDGQVRVVRAALERAGIDPATIDYVEAHGTGTPLGDPIEVAALTEAFGPVERGGRPIALGAVKANVGHLECAAGVAGLIKVAHALDAAELPPQPEFEAPNPRIPFARTPFAVGTRRRPWPAPAGHPRRAAVSAFGIGGTNAHAVLEEAPPPVSTPDDGRPRLLPLSAKSPAALRRLAEATRDHLAASTDALGDVCYTAGLGRDHHGHRLAILAGDRGEAIARLDAFLGGAAGPGIFAGARWADGEAPVPAKLDLAGLAAVAGAYVIGARVDWRRLYAGERRRKVRLPGHPLAPRVFRAGPLQPPRSAPPLHPMIERVVDGPRSVVAEGRLSHARLPFLPDHLVDGRPVLPGVAWIEMIRAAAEQWAGTADLRLEDIAFELPLEIPPGVDPVRAQVVLSPTAGGEATVEAFARGPDGAWTRHVSGRVAPDTDAPPQAEPAPPGRAIDVAALFDWFAERRLGYGPRMRAIAALVRADGVAHGRIERPTSATGWPAPPAMLDAALQSVAAFAMGEADDRATHLPAHVGRFRLHRPLPDAVDLRIRLDAEAPPGIVRADIALFDDAGACVAQIDGMVYRALDGGVRREPTMRLDWRRLDRRGAAGEPGRWLVIAPPDGDAPPIADWLAEAGADVARVDPDAAPDAHLDRPLDGIAFVAPSTADPAAATAAVSRAVALIAALAARRAALPSGLWFVTRGAADAGPEDAVPRPALAALHGLARVCAAEHPELGAAALDLDPLGATEDADAVLGELLGAEGEPLVALRRDGRHVPRLRADAGRPPPPPGLPEDDRPWSLEVSTRGDLGGLVFAPAERVAPPADGVEVEVWATGLNFRDVLNALGRYPGDPGPVGGEMAGIVTRIGPDVTRVAVGDRVFGLAPRCFADRVVTFDRLVARVPDGLAFEQAAGLPLTGLTALEALTRIAGLGAGDRVLIHAGAGGVGLAAIELAHALGAEVFATASPAKWPLLRARGVERIYNSRTTDFAAQIRAETGGEGVDVVLNSLALEGLEASFEATRPGGVVVDIAKNDAAALRARFADRRYTAYDLAVSSLADRDVAAEMLDALCARLARGEAQPPPMRVWPIERAVDAFRALAAARHVGKSVVSQVARRRRLAGWPGRVPPGGVLITGGLGDLGLATARWLAERGAESVVLLGRRGVRTEAQRAAVAAIEALGATVRVVTGDVAAPETIDAALDALPPSGLAGVIHAAGVLDDGLLVDLDPARIAAVMAPKIAGAWALDRAVDRLDPVFFVLYGSATALTGSPGQGPYAAANAALAALAHHRRARGRPATVIDWGPWADIGMAARLDTRHQARMAGFGLRPLPPARALAALAQVLRDDRARAVVMPFDRGAVRGPTPPLFADLVGAPRAADEGDLAARLAGLDRAGRVEALAEHVAKLVAHAVGLDPTLGIDPRRPLAELGVDSLMSIELRNVLGRSLGRTLSATALFEYPTVEALSGWLADAIGGHDSEPSGKTSVPSVSSIPSAAVIEPSADATPPPPAEEDLSALDEDTLAALLRAELDDEDEP